MKVRIWREERELTGIGEDRGGVCGRMRVYEEEQMNHIHKRDTRLQEEGGG